MLRIVLTVLLSVALAPPPAAAQEWLGGDDFLTNFEVEIIRTAQEPNDRIAAYLEFAALRLELVGQLLAEEEEGRGAKIHKNLDDYGRILEAIDMVIDDALLRDVDLEKGMTAVVEQEQAFLTKLEKIEEDEPEDLWRYEFVLENAVEITSDSLEMAGVDPQERKREVIEGDEAEKAAREKTMTRARREDVQETQEAFQKAEQEAETNRPSLLKKDETLEKYNDPIPDKKKKKKD